MRSQSSARVAGASSSRSRITPCCSKVGLKRGPWTPDEDKLLTDYINKEGEGRWRTLPKKAGLLRCGKSCRLRWMNYLRPSVKRGHITPDEEDLILRLHRLLGNRWSLIAGRIPGRTDNEIKNYWNTHLSKKLISQGIDPKTHKPLGNPSNDNDSENHISAPIPINPTTMTFPVPPANQEMAVNGSSSVNVGGTNQLHVQQNSGGGTNQIEEQLHHQYNNGSDLNMDAAGGISTGNEELGMDFCTDEMFSSFLDSLMKDDDMFTSSAAKNNQQPNENTMPSTSEYYHPSTPFNHMNFPFSTAGWDDDDLLP